MAARKCRRIEHSHIKGAIDEIDDPDALAGVVAHEIAHVRRRHVTEALIRELGIGALIRLFAGDVGANAEQIISLSYTRDNEAEADSYAIAMLKKAGISPKPTADLFKQLSKEQGEGYAYNAEFLQSHPLSGSRAKRFAAAEEKGVHYRRALSDEEFDALKRMCPNTKDNERSLTRKED
jgi:predicted Zn-dependent protease